MTWMAIHAREQFAILDHHSEAGSARFPVLMTDFNSGKELDNALLLQVATGDRNAFARLYDRLSGPLYSMALNMLDDRQEAEDALQEGMAQLWVKAPQFDPQRSAAFTWCVMLFRSRLVDRLRKRSSRKRTLERATLSTALDPDEPPVASELTDLRERCELVHRALESLDADQSRLLRLAFLDGCTHNELAEATGKPLGTVKTIIRRALLELRRRLNQEDYQR